MEKALVLNETKNQFGNMIPEQEIIFKDGHFALETLTCFGSEQMGMGTCQCLSHTPYDSRPLSRNEVIDLCNAAHVEIPAEALREDIETLISERFYLEGLTALENDLEAAYRLGINPLPRLRQILKGLPVDVAFAYEGNVFFDAAKRKAVFAVFLDSDTGTVRTELFDQYHTDGVWYRIMESEDITC